MNSYSNIASYYDLLMTSGYYDYKALASDLNKVVASGDRILELGVGTGLMAREFLEMRPDVSFTGIDNTAEMLELGRARLGTRANLHLADVGDFDSDEKYDVVFSCGGVWYLIDADGEEFQLCSHIPDIQASREAFANIRKLVRPGGCVLMSIQGVHRDFDQELDGGVTYRQRIQWDGQVFHKEYIFENGKDTAVQHCTYRILHEPDMQMFFTGANLTMAEMPIRKFRLFRCPPNSHEEI